MCAQNGLPWLALVKGNKDETSGPRVAQLFLTHAHVAGCSQNASPANGGDGQNALHCAETHELALNRCTIKASLSRDFRGSGMLRLHLTINVSSTAMIESIDKQSQFSTYTILGCPFCDPLLKA